VDETLDVLAAHGVAGFTGIVFIGFVAQTVWNGVSNGLLYGNIAQLGEQAVAALVAPAYAFGATFALLKLIGLFSPLRVAAREEALGMDIVSHGEDAYATGEGAILVEPESPLVPHPVGALAAQPRSPTAPPARAAARRVSS
jgi:Amt family ammonium transporter